jgi:DNA-binding transcriptional ArsR family regulator
MPKKPAPQLAPASYIAAYTHETRVHAMSVLTERTASPAEIAKELDREIRHVMYHLECLEELGLIELVKTEPAAGGRVVQKFYRATQRIWFDREAWKKVKGPKAKHTAAIMGLINQDIAIAMGAGTFDGEENHISRTPMLLDEEGWKELVDYLAEVLDEIFNIKSRAASRITKDSETVVTIANIVQFDMPTSSWKPPDPGVD